MRRIATIGLFLTLALFSGELRVASYNVENLFDLKYDGTEYKEYIPNTGAGWNKRNYIAKLHNISKVISTVNPDIIGLQEIESLDSLKDLQAMLRAYPYKIDYKYFAFASEKKRKSAVTTALLSKYPIEYSREVKVTNHLLNRNILEVGIKVNNETLRVFVNHWKSKSGPESKRVRSADYLMKRLSELDDEAPYILLGDFNSNHDEYITFKKSKSLNDTDGKTGINHTLGTVDIDDWKTTQWLKNLFGMELDVSFVTKDMLEDSDDNELHYNLWLDLDEENRWSYKHGKKLETLDNMIISKGLVDGEGIDYKDGSFRVFRGVGTVDKRGKVYRWQRGKKKEHLGKGFSDHLLIYTDLKF
jgi:endonuclease/exonuclease/phosphatase family metal-dependent hydrolase